MSRVERQEALRRVLAGDLSGWHGLPPSTDAEDFAAVSEGGGVAGEGRLSGMPTVFRDYTGHRGLLRVFFDDDDHAFLVWVDWAPSEADVGTAFAHFDPPDARLDDAPSRHPGTVQWVWGTRGVTAYVDGWNRVRGLALFAPASVEYYRFALGGGEDVPYRPRRGSG